MRRIILSVVALTCMAGAVGAQSIYPADYERFLLPILIEPTSGAHGSVWQSSFLLFNGSDVPLDFYPGDCTLPVCPSVPIPSWEVYPPPTVYAAPGESSGRLFYVRRDSAADVSFALRVKDIQAQARAEGTEVPVVRESDLKTGKTQLLDVPVDGNSRATLRMYEPDASGTGVVRVAVYSQDDATLLAHADFVLAVGAVADPPVEPGYARITDLAATFPELAGHDRVRVQLEPLSPGLRYWAFVTVANNETQFVTTITEQ